MDRKLVREDDLQIEGRTYTVRYYETTTARGTRRFSADITLSENDHIIFDGASMPDLEAKVRRQGPATVYSRTVRRTWRS
jgi:hypothetical protein